MFKQTAVLVKRELKIGFADLNRVITPLSFFGVVLTMMPLGLGPEPRLLAQVAPGLVWVVALLAILISSDRLFGDDMADGALQQLMLIPLPLSLVSFAKTVAWWLMTMVPLAVIAPIFGMMLGLAPYASLVMAATLLIGGLGLCLVGAISAALTLSTGAGAALVALIALPLFVPILIFGSAAVESASLGLAVKPYIFILLAFDMMAIVLAPLATAAALRVAVDD